MGNGTTRFAHKYDSYFCALPNTKKSDHESTVNMLVDDLKGKGYSENPRLLRTNKKQ